MTSLFIEHVRSMLVTIFNRKKTIMNPKQLSGILSDRQIRELCTPPSFVVTVQCREPWAMHMEGTFEMRNEFSWRTAKELEEKVTQYRMAFKPSKYLGIVSYRPVKPEEIASFNPMLSPFEPKQVRVRRDFDGKIDRNSYTDIKILSLGLSSMGYDVSLARDIKIFSNVNSVIVNPKKFDEKCLVDAKIQVDEEGSEYVIMPPNSYLLGHTVETFNIPRDVMVIALGKSTYARAGAIVNVTPIEPGFVGTVVIEVSNSTPLPLMIFIEEGISQFTFFRSTEECEVSYADGNRKYQGQTGLVLPRT